MALAGPDCAATAAGISGPLPCVSPRSCWPGLGRWGRTRQRLAADRIGLDHLRDLWTAAKEGARHHGYTGARGYHPLLAIADGHRRGADVPAARGPRPTPSRRAIAHFLHFALAGQWVCGRHLLALAGRPPPGNGWLSPVSGERPDRVCERDTRGGLPFPECRFLCAGDLHPFPVRKPAPRRCGSGGSEAVGPSVALFASTAWRPFIVGPRGQGRRRRVPQPGRRWNCSPADHRPPRRGRERRTSRRRPPTNADGVLAQ